MARREGETFKEAWSRCANLLYVHVTRHQPGDVPSKSGSFRQTMTAFFKACPDVSDRWVGQTAASARDRFAPGHKRNVAWYAAAYECARLGHAMASGDGSWLSPPEVAWLAGLGHSVSPSSRVNEVRLDEVDGVLHVDFAVVFDGRDGRRPRSYRSRGTATVERIPCFEVDETIAFRTRNGTKVTARRVGAAWMRTLVGPEGREAMDEAAFANACAGTMPWKDDPFRRKETVVTAYARVAPPAISDMADGDGGHANVRARETALREAASRPVRIASIDGIVHVATSAPTLHACRHVVGVKVGDVPRSLVEEVALGLGWAMDEVDSETDFDVVGAVVHAPDWSCGYDWGRARRFPSFALRDVAFAREFARRTAEHMRMPFDDATPDLPAGALDAPAAMAAALTGLVTHPLDDSGYRVSLVRDAARIALGRGSVGAMLEAAASVSSPSPCLVESAAKALCETSALAMEGLLVPDASDEDEVASLTP